MLHYNNSIKAKGASNSSIFILDFSASYFLNESTDGLLYIMSENSELLK